MFGIAALRPNLRGEAGGDEVLEVLALITFTVLDDDSGSGRVVEEIGDDDEDEEEDCC